MNDREEYLIGAGILRGFRSTLDGRRPRVLHHYTTASGFLGIVATGSLFLSDAMFLNDQSEIVYARDVISEALARRIQNEKDGAWKAVFQSAEHIFLQGDVHTFLRFFIASFCSSGNLLSQWRAYGAPGSGYALGFETRDLCKAKITLDESLGVQLRPIVYKRERQLHIANDLVSACQEKLKSLGWSGNDKEELNNGRNIVALALTTVLPLFKHPIFGEEREWRLVVLTVGDQAQPYLRFRSACRQLVPYLMLDLKHTTKTSLLPLVSVLHAPVDEPELRKRATRDLLHANGYSDSSVSILGSDIPLRLP